jgi:hypothetical protein
LLFHSCRKTFDDLTFAADDAKAEWDGKLMKIAIPAVPSDAAIAAKAEAEAAAPAGL